MLAFGLAPVALSPWYMNQQAARRGLLLGIATAPVRHIARSCVKLQEVIQRLV